jgi:hypothetical protein
MKVEGSNATPIWVSPRHGNGCTVIQGRNRVLVSRAELPYLLAAIQEVGELTS